MGQSYGSATYGVEKALTEERAAFATTDALNVEIKNRAGADTSEAVIRGNNDGDLAARIAAETSARITNDDAERSARAGADETERVARIQADNEEAANRSAAIAGEVSARNAAIAAAAETGTSIKAKLGISVLSGANTGDQVIPTTLPASDVYPWAKAPNKPSYTPGEIGAAAASHAHDSIVNGGGGASVDSLGNLINNGGVFTGVIEQRSGQYTYPGSTTGENYQTSWFLASHSAYGLYTNTGMYLASSLYCAGDVAAYYSDERLKNNLGNIKNALDKVCSLNGFIYTNNELAGTFGYTDPKRQLGVSAQQVKVVLPEAVTLAPFDTMCDSPDAHESEKRSKSGENYLTVHYEKFAPLFIEAIKELRDEYKKEITSLKAEIDLLRKG